MQSTQLMLTFIVYISFKAVTRTLCRAEMVGQTNDVHVLLKLFNAKF